MIACELGRITNVQALLEHFEKRSKGNGATKNNKEDEEMEEDDEGDDDDKMKINVDFINFKDRSSRTALQYAAYYGHAKISEALIDAGAEVDTKNSKQLVSITLRTIILL